MMEIVERQADQILKGLVVGIYRMTQGDGRGVPRNLRVIDQPGVAHSIFRAPDIFVKNYGFLESSVRGRFSANGEEWRLRAALTQPYLNRAAELVGQEGLGQIYRKHLVELASGNKPSLFQAFLDSAVEVVSKGFGLQTPLPWTESLVTPLRRRLKVQQALAWLPFDPAASQTLEAELKELVEEVRSNWMRNQEAVSFMRQMESKSQGIAGFDPAQELIQTLVAASETAASGLLWMVECLGRWPGSQVMLRQGGEETRDLFVKEALRLFPAIPFVSRVSNKAVELDNESFAQHESILISIVGLHCNRGVWKNPLEFQLPRKEFVEESYDKKAYVPFLSGPRVCGGMRLALAEFHAALPQFLDLFEVLPITTPVEFEYGLASRPGRPLEPMLVHRYSDRV